LVDALSHPVRTLEHGVHAAERGALAALDTATAAPRYLTDRAIDLLPDDIRLGPKLPPYPTISPAEKAKALSRSRGLTHAQSVITDDTDEKHEPVNLFVAGTRAELKQALEAQGWEMADELDSESGFKTVFTVFNKLTSLSKLVNFNYESSPVSDMFLDGKRHEMAFNKNNRHDMARDHLRLWPSAQKDATGRPIWAIAATRDTAMHIHLKDKRGGHETDPAIDGERDLIMSDLLASGRVRDWQVAKAEPTPADEAHIARKYRTDGNLYVVDLAPGAGNGRDGEFDQRGTIRKLLSKAPEPLRGALEKVDDKLTDFFRGLG